MAISVPDVIVPSGPYQPYLVEDLYFKGGMRVVPTAADLSLTPATPGARPKIPRGARKGGMLVATADDGKLWQLGTDLVTFTEFVSGGGSMTGVLPITVMINGDIKIEPYAVLPSGGVPGDVVTLGADNLPTWRTLTVAGNTGIRQTGSFPLTSALATGDSLDFDLPMSRTVLLLYLAVDAPDIQVEAFSEPSRTEANPYKFVSVAGTLADVGISVLPNNTTYNGRRYSILANLEAPNAQNQTPNANVIYWRVTNLGTIPATPTLTFTYLILE